MTIVPVVPFSADIADIAGVLLNIQPEPPHFRFAVLQCFKLLLGLQARPGVISPMLHISLNNPFSIRKLHAPFRQISSLFCVSAFVHIGYDDENKVSVHFAGRGPFRGVLPLSECAIYTLLNIVATAAYIPRKCADNDSSTNDKTFHYLRECVPFRIAPSVLTPANGFPPRNGGQSTAHTLLRGHSRIIRGYQ